MAFRYACEFSHKLNSDLGVEVIALSDTVGSADANTIKSAFVSSIKELPQVEFGAHLHLKLTDGLGKIEAALEGGCKRFDGAIRGIGGCPMAQDSLVGNAPTRKNDRAVYKKGKMGAQRQRRLVTSSVTRYRNIYFLIQS